MASIYSTRFVAGSFANGTVLYTVPSGNVAVVRSITTVILVSGASGSVAIGGSGSFISHNTATTAGQGFQDSIRQVLNAGETLVASSSSGNVVLTISGYLLTA